MIINGKKGLFIKMSIAFALVIAVLLFALSWLVTHPAQKEVLVEVVGAFIRTNSTP